MNEQTLATANQITRDLDLLTNYGTAIQAEQDNPATTPGEMLALLNRSYALLSVCVNDTDSVNALNVVIEDARDAFKASIADSIEQLNTALTALCTPQ
jgi:hypothetical protein